MEPGISRTFLSTSVVISHFSTSIGGPLKLELLGPTPGARGQGSRGPGFHTFNYCRTSQAGRRNSRLWGAMEVTRPEYWLPTYGVDYPGTEGGSHGVQSSQLFRPVEYQSTQKLLSDIRAERSKAESHKKFEQQQQEELGGASSSSAMMIDNLVPPLVRPASVKAVAQKRELWEDFLEIGNEMIVTRLGR